MQFQVLSSFGLVALNGAVAFRAERSPGCRASAEHLRFIHREHAERICKPEHLRSVLDRMFGTQSKCGVGDAARGSVGDTSVVADRVIVWSVAASRIVCRRAAR